jgi:MinD-like ATPase involved in chromosome partitioning or flagellar assembly
MNQNLLYTWIDVDFVLNRKLASDKPAWLLDASAYNDGLFLKVVVGTRIEIVNEALREWFGQRFVPEKGLLLDGIPEQPRSFPIFIEEGSPDEAIKANQLKPFFRDIALLPEQSDQLQLPSPLPDSTPPIFAFYSFKGGVGRTTHLLAFLQSLSSRGLSALLVDADLEAPGLTYLAKAEISSRPTEFSFVDFLAMAHASPDDTFEIALLSASYALKRQPLTVKAGTKEIEHYILPAFRNDDQSLTIDVRPEHLVSRFNRHWILPELLGDLGRRLGTDCILVDLRAGLSELASPILFDPRSRRILVTTPSKQSLEGTRIVLHELAKVAPPKIRQDLFDPTIILSFVLQEMMDSEALFDITTMLFKSYPQDELSISGTDQADGVNNFDFPRIGIEQTAFAQELLYLSSITDALAKLESTTLSKIASKLSEEVVSQRNAISPFNAPSTPYDVIRKNLAELASDLEFAESGRGEKFLRIPPLRTLARQFHDNIPIAVIVGSKGAGKTYTCLQVIRSKKWSGFVEIATALDNSISQSSLVNDFIWPLFQSTNLKETAKNVVDECRIETATGLGISGQMSSIAVEDAIRESLRHPGADETWWRHRWFSILAKSLGLDSSIENESASRIISYLRKQNKKLLVVVDGLEDLFPALESSPNQQVALRSLLQGVPNYLRELPNSPLGALIFVRADLVRSGIPQNTGQFLKLYAPYTLRWNDEEALRLAVWLSNTSGLPADKVPELLSPDEAKEFLVSVWGRKLGSDSSREARSAEWVIAALSDFRGQIQARDLVRFFRFAAASPRNIGTQDRLLAPRAVRDAIVPCSAEKIEEIKQEIPALDGIFRRLQQATNRRIPFDAASSSLTATEIHFLEDIGVLIEDRGEYFMPEIFRFGLGFQLSQGARPRVLSLARRALTTS